MDLGFRGEVAELYARYRPGYPAAVLDALVAAFGLTGEDVVVDLGCATGQLGLPMAGRVRAVLGVDPEPDMVTLARSAAAERGVRNASWLVGTDSDVPALAALLGEQSVGAIMIGQALHWMDHERLFREARPLLRAGGGVAVLANGTPLWLQDSGWSRALKEFLEGWFGQRLTATCGTDEATQQRYRAALAAAGYQPSTTNVDDDGLLDADRIVGGVLSALPVGGLPPPDRRAAFADGIEEALRPHAPYEEHVRVAILTGRVG